ncbi:MAG: carbohydrate ABC transporter permease [Thermomicrobiales bacterium]|nr:MAG: carbohydrate ABC transporter permease [Thermomicrobiales bacterium]
MNIVGENRWWQRLLYFYLPLGIFVVLLLFPFYWMLIVSFRPDKDLLNTERNPFLPNLLQRTDGFPWIELDTAGVTLRHYRFLFNDTDFVRWLQNSIIVTVGATALALVCSVFIGYALGRFRFRGGTIMGAAIFIAYLVPPTLLFIPLAEIVARFGLYNRYWALILTYPTFLIPFASWLLMGYFQTISHELEDAALVDGASRLQAMRQIILPLAMPGVLSAGIFCFTLAWNEFLYALVFMGTGNMKTVPVGVVSDLIKADVYFWGPLMAAAVLGSVPVAIAYSFFVDNYVSGLTAGATKG